MRQSFKLLTSVLILSFASVGCSNDDKGTVPPVQPTAEDDRQVDENSNPKRFSVVTYNLENLFDANHDEGKNDYQFLPLGHPEKKAGCMKSSKRYRKYCLETNWTDEVVDQKIAQLRKALMKSGAPDVVAVQEVENAGVLARLAAAMGSEYTSILVEGQDKRGIDTGMIYKESKLTYKSHVSRTIVGEHFKTKPTRDVLTAYFELKADTADHKKTIAVYSNHWPSQASKAPVRVTTAEQVKDFIIADQAKYGVTNLYVIMTGDFNVVPKDHPHPFHEVVFPFLTDVRDYAESKGQDMRKQAFGTYFYAREMAWNKLDRFFVSENLIDDEGLDFVVGSYQIMNYKFLTKTFVYNRADLPFYGSVVADTPMRFDFKTSEGASDHFGVRAEFELK